MANNKIREFLDRIDKGEDIEKAAKNAGISMATAKTQMSKRRKERGEIISRKKKEIVKEEDEDIDEDEKEDDDLVIDEEI